MPESTLSSGYSKVLSPTKLREKGRALLCRQNANADPKSSLDPAGEPGQRDTVGGGGGLLWVTQENGFCEWGFTWPGDAEGADEWPEASPLLCWSSASTAREGTNQVCCLFWP